jgi:hypothetical protein
VRRACRDNDAQAAGRALLQWGRDRWSRDPPANLVVLAGRCGGRAGAAIEELDQYLYGNGPQHWEGSTLESALRELPASSMSRSAKNGVLLPLTPTDYDLAGAKVPPNV